MSVLRLPNGGELLPEVVERFWTKVDKSGGPDACWPWTRLVDKDGYGKFQVSTGYRTQWHIRAHRFVLLIVVGRHFKELALHSCDNPPCCNPKHLHIGTQKQNREECAARGRTAKVTGFALRDTRGEAHPSVRLNSQQVREIRLRARVETGAELARAYGVKRNVVYGVLSGRTWSHLP